MKQNKWIVTSLLLSGRMPVARPGSSAVESGVSAGYAYNQYSIDTNMHTTSTSDGRGGVTVGIPVEYGILTGWRYVPTLCISAKGLLNATCL